MNKLKMLVSAMVILVCAESHRRAASNKSPTGRLSSSCFSLFRIRPFARGLPTRSSQTRLTLKGAISPLSADPQRESPTVFVTSRLNLFNSR